MRANIAMRHQLLVDPRSYYVGRFWQPLKCGPDTGQSKIRDLALQIECSHARVRSHSTYGINARKCSTHSPQHRSRSYYCQ